jgi:hypothetical protein
MVDAPHRPEPRFPPSLEPRVAGAIRTTLVELDAGAADFGITSAACGSDILFAEAAHERAVRLRIHLPFDEQTFLSTSVEFANSDWPERYWQVLKNAEVLRAPDVLGGAPSDADPYACTNLWMLDEARRIGAGTFILISVWDGEKGDGPGGTKHMMQAARDSGGAVYWIDIRTLW